MEKLWDGIAKFGNLSDFDDTWFGPGEVFEARKRYRKLIDQNATGTYDELVGIKVGENEEVDNIDDILVLKELEVAKFGQKPAETVAGRREQVGYRYELF
jgi:hypothetical protein